jgi:predicted XRE-type DNA-binding protein
MKKSVPAAKDPARNVWLALGMPDAEEHFLKAQLVLRLDRTIARLKLTQQQAAQRVGATQPELSKILRGKFSEVSLERLMRFLSALGHRVEIKVGSPRKGRKGEVVVSASGSN